MSLTAILGSFYDSYLFNKLRVIDVGIDVDQHHVREDNTLHAHHPATNEIVYKDRELQIY